MSEKTEKPAHCVGQLRVEGATERDVRASVQGPHGRQELVVGGSDLVGLNGMTFVPASGDVLPLLISLQRRVTQLVHEQIQARHDAMAEAKRRQETLEESTRHLDADDYSQVDPLDDEPSITIPDAERKPGYGIRDTTTPASAAEVE